MAGARVPSLSRATRAAMTGGRAVSRSTFTPGGGRISRRVNAEATRCRWLRTCSGCARARPRGFSHAPSACRMSEAPNVRDLRAAFAPLTDEERTATGRRADGVPEWCPLQPVPEGAAAPNFLHYELGAPEGVPGNPWRYTDAEGKTL